MEFRSEFMEVLQSKEFEKLTNAFRPSHGAEEQNITDALWAIHGMLDQIRVHLAHISQNTADMIDK